MVAPPPLVGHARFETGRGLAIAAILVLAATQWLDPLLAYLLHSGEPTQSDAAQVAATAVVALWFPALVLGLGAICARAGRLVLTAAVLSAASLTFELVYRGVPDLAATGGRPLVMTVAADVAATVVFLLAWRRVVRPLVAVAFVAGIVVFRFFGIEAVLYGIFGVWPLLDLAIVGAAGLLGWPTSEPRGLAATILASIVVLGLLFLVAQAAEGMFPGWLLFISTSLSLIDGVLGTMRDILWPVFGPMSPYLLVGYAVAALLAMASAARTP